MRRLFLVGPVVLIVLASFIGIIWFTSFHTTGAITEYAIPTSISGSLGITEGPGGNLWFTEDAIKLPVESGTIPESFGQIGRISPNGAITEFPIPLPSGVSGTLDHSNLSGITTGADGNLWFTDSMFFDFGPTEGYVDEIGRITPKGTITIEYSNCTSSGIIGNLFEITSGPDGNLWFAEGNKIGRIATGK